MHGQTRILRANLTRFSPKAPVKFFDVTPVGRIVNRFTSDMASIDQSVIYQWSSLSDYLLTTCVAMMISSIATPAVLDGIVYLRTTTTLWAFGEPVGE